MTVSSCDKEIHLEQLRQYIFRMPSLSTTMQKVLEICNTPHASPNDLNHVISLDPVLTGKVLRLINSAYYSLRNPVTSLTRAIIMLGVNTVKNLALSAAVLESIGGKETFKGFSVDDFWLHSLGVGVTSRFIAAQQGIPLSEREEYFVAGLLHDLGKIPLNRLYATEYADVLKKMENDDRSLQEMEQESFGIDHCLVGEMIIEKWQLGRNFLNALRHHHQPANAPQQDHPFVSIIAIADLLINIQEIGSAGNLVKGQDIPSALDRIHHADLHMNHSTLDKLKNTVQEEIDKARIFLQISQEGQLHAN